MVEPHRIDALPVVAIVAFLVMWLHSLTALGNGTGRPWVMHSPWRYWGPPAIAAAMLFVVGVCIWRRSRLGAWVRSAIAGAVGMVPALLFALIPGLFAGVLILGLWNSKPDVSGHRGPADWFTRPDNYGGDPVALALLVAGPIALAIATAMAPALADLLSSRPRCRPRCPECPPGPRSWSRWRSRDGSSLNELPRSVRARVS